jgi:tRNA threonylcarbamoyladenosine biosynthesis protein TsaB
MNRPALPALAIETSGRIGSVALAGDGKLLAEQPFPHGLAHAARIIPVIDSLSRAHDLKPADLREIYVSVGPGSFTGLRIGITVAKTMALATGAKLVAVPSVRVLAENAPAEAMHVVIVLDAKRGQIFTARFERLSAAPTLTLPRITGGGESRGWIEREPAHLDTLAAVVARAPRPLYLLGEGLPYHPLPPEDRVIAVEPSRSQARASVVAELGNQMARAGEFTEAMKLLPQYVRPPEAEEKFKG